MRSRRARTAQVINNSLSLQGGGGEVKKKKKLSLFETNPYTLLRLSYVLSLSLSFLLCDVSRSSKS